ncbi:hypothetical protein [Streptomyces collinus]|uniref:hypothetical protein n=1 Tax=Streptomyces collinus TaxID=42684 RepID=UPI00379E27E8
MTSALYAPVVEIYVVRHPADRRGEDIAEDLLAHFRGDRFTGLLDGVVDVYVRSAGLHGEGSAPKPIPFPGRPDAQAEYVVVVPLLGEHWSRAAEDTDDPWHDYALGIRQAWEAQGPQPRLGVFPVMLTDTPLSAELDRLLGGIQRLAAPGPAQPEALQDTQRRDLSQGIAQLVQGNRKRLTVFISHTRLGQHAPAGIIERVRAGVRGTRLGEWIDCHSLLPGTDSTHDLLDNAADGVMLAVRSDQYASRQWCQKEVLTAKRAGVPVVFLDALEAGDRRGSFLMDHAPQLCVGSLAGEEADQAIRRALNLLVDEYLKRVLWCSRRQSLAAQPGLDIDWWAPQPPEPATLSQWLRDWLAGAREAGRAVEDARPRIVHPGPPLGEDEIRVLNDMAIIGGIHRGLDITTVELLAARGA